MIFNTRKLICIFFYFHHTDRNHSIKSHIVTLTNLEKRMLIYVLDLFDGGLKPPKSPLESATEGIYFVSTYFYLGRRGRGRMVVGFTTMYLACRVFPKNRLPAKLTVSNDFLAGSNGKKKIREKKMSNK